MKPAAPHISKPSQTSASSRGFTLLEIMIAITIFSVVMTSIYATFRTATRAYERGLEMGTILQAGRFGMDTVARDIKNTFYKQETDYNATYRQNLQNIENILANAEENPVNPRDLEKMIDDFNTKCVGLDIAFRGGAEELTFVRRQLHVGSRPVQPMHLARVRYYLSENKLLREEHDIFKLPVDYAAEEIVPEQTNPETILDNVEKFELFYGFYYDGEWMECQDWDSSARKNRVDSVNIAGNDDLSELLKQNLQQFIDQAPEDGPPGYVRVVLTVREKRDKKSKSKEDEDEGRLSTFTRTINISNSAETHEPLPEEFAITDAEGQTHSFTRGQFVLGHDGEKRGRRYGLQSSRERRRNGGGR